MPDWVIAACAPCTSRLRNHGAGVGVGEREREPDARALERKFEVIVFTQYNSHLNSINTLVAASRAQTRSTNESPSRAMLRSVLSRTRGRPCSEPRCRLSTLRVVPSTADRQLALPLAFLSVEATPLGCATLACIRLFPVPS